MDTHPFLTFRETGTYQYSPHTDTHTFKLQHSRPLEVGRCSGPCELLGPAGPCPGLCPPALAVEWTQLVVQLGRRTHTAAGKSGETVRMQKNKKDLKLQALRVWPWPPPLSPAPRLSESCPSVDLSHTRHSILCLSLRDSVALGQVLVPP